MTQTFDLLIRGGHLVNHDGEGLADVGVKDGRIAAIGALGAASAGAVIEAKGLHVLPGVIDTQVHFREPGKDYKEDLETGSRAAALGGVTAVFEMPNTDPATTTPDALNDKIRRATGRMHVDFAFFAGGANDNLPALIEMERMEGCCGVKVFMGASTGSLLVREDERIETILSAISRRAAFHCEDDFRMVERAGLAVPGDWSSHPVVRDAESALIATRRLISIARRTGARVHVLHVTTAEEMAFLAEHKDVATVEVLPNHLTLHAPDCYERLKGYAQQNPPIREKRHQDALWAALGAGVVDVVGSDHAPHTREEKERPYPQSASGTPGVQTLLPVMLTHVAEGRLGLQRLVDLLCHGPNRIFGIARKGRLAVGYDADLTLVDLKAEVTITHAQQASKVGWTPFDGMRAKGWPIATIVRGRQVMRDGALIETGQGAPIQFQETLRPR